jgi:hypothetical protein
MLGLALILLTSGLPTAQKFVMLPASLLRFGCSVQAAACSAGFAAKPDLKSSDPGPVSCVNREVAQTATHTSIVRA